MLDVVCLYIEEELNVFPMSIYIYDVIYLLNKQMMYAYIMRYTLHGTIKKENGSSKIPENDWKDYYPCQI
jgi:hypothetical protein